MANRVVIEAALRFGTPSPLRYPGGKAVLAGLFADVLKDLHQTGACYVEPYAGGVGAGVALLKEGLVDHLVINDIDPAVHAFWWSVVNRNSEMVELLREVPVTLDEWHSQRDIYRAGDAGDPVRLGFAFFYLNRTNRSGVLSGGVIGGQAQRGKDLIDARFYRDTLTGRLRDLGALAPRITVLDLDGRTVIGRYADDPSVLMYIDPPYLAAGSRLYLNAFDGRDHIALAEAIGDIKETHWLLTYDLVPFLERLYRNHYQCRLRLKYSGGRYGKAEELVVASPRVARVLRRHAYHGPELKVLEAVGG